jgi:hypothetical protein
MTDEEAKKTFRLCALAPLRWVSLLCPHCGGLEAYEPVARTEGVTHGDIVERDARKTLDFEDFEGQRLSLIDDGRAGEAHACASQVSTYGAGSPNRLTRAANSREPGADGPEKAQALRRVGGQLARDCRISGVDT